MSNKEIRVRFAPSPTGGLHIGGVRTLLYNYLFAKKNKGKLILRIEDTDQTRFVFNAEEYIYDCLKWCNIEADEGVIQGGDYGPYKQSERKEIYLPYALDLVEKGHAYYAFDTVEELAEMREKFKTKENPSPQYDANTRMQMKNSLTLGIEESLKKIKAGEDYVIRALIPQNETVIFEDAVRGTIHHDTNTLDDKVLIKTDGMPTYHMAVVVDDYLMKISHIMRGEEWLPSTPLHVLLWKQLGWEADLPTFAHLPLILKPDGNGKLSKRDGDRLGFPVFAMDWKDANSGEIVKGFKEMGFLPEAFLNLLAFLGWSSGEEREIYSMKEMTELFSLDRIHKGGAKFDYEKAKWFNEQHIKNMTAQELLPFVKNFYPIADTIKENDLLWVIDTVKERCQLLTEFWEQSFFFFEDPESLDMDSLKKGWNEEKELFFKTWIEEIKKQDLNNPDSWKDSFENLIKEKAIKKGAVMMPLRVMLVGGKFGPGIFDITSFIGKEKTMKRIEKALTAL
ncbi:MAG TPA: glutamate--tRNA ligase [Chitinophagaceae bacterium]|nr:glutamate--tRNA ligase [Chitinophagaceae bacterium]